MNTSELDSPCRGAAFDLSRVLQRTD